MIEGMPPQVDFIWATPDACDPPHKITKPDQVEAIAKSLLEDGWIGNALVGYRCGQRVQLLSGTHRHAAARAAGNVALPVVVWQEDDVWKAFGDEVQWELIMHSGDVMESSSGAVDNDINTVL